MELEEKLDQDNIIEWVFEKMFDQLTMDSSELFHSPFDCIKTKTFSSENIHTIIHNLTKRPIKKIAEYLSKNAFQERFLFGKIKKKLYVQILLGNLIRVKSLVCSAAGYLVDNNCYVLAIINNRFDIIRFMDSMPMSLSIKPSSELLYYCAEFGYEDIYFYLREKNLLPNISIFNIAATSNSLSIIKDINIHITLSSTTLTNAFQANNTDIILYLIDEAIKEKIAINQNLMTYPILNNNTKLLDQMEKMKLIDWHMDLYYSAILSGSVDMMKYLEEKIPDIHKDKILDKSRRGSAIGLSTVLSSDMIYEIAGKKYFSHAVNYAVQSKSINVLKYILDYGYAITPSNFVTAIRQGTIEILKLLCNNYKNILPFYYQHYFSINSYIPNKIDKARILFGRKLLNFEPGKKLSINDYRAETAHIEIINQITHLAEDVEMDLDYLLKYRLFFIPKPGFKLNQRLLTQTKICLELDLTNKLVEIFQSKSKSKLETQLLTDCLFLFGTITQIKNLYQLLPIHIPPSQCIIMEILCYCQISKICFLLHHNLLTSDILHNIYPIVTMLSDTFMNSLFDKMAYQKPELKYVLKSGKKMLIDKAVEHEEQEKNISKDNIKDILALDDLDLVKKINIPQNLLPELIEWTQQEDLLEIKSYLKSYLKSLEN